MTRPVLPQMETYAEIIERCARHGAVIETMRTVMRESIANAATMRKSAQAMRLRAALARRQGRRRTRRSPVRDQ